MTTKVIATASIEILVNGVRKEIKPGHPFEIPKGQEAALAGAYREASEAEVALYEKQDRLGATATKSAPAIVMKEPAAANGPGGATGEDTSPNRGASSVAADTSTTGASEEGKGTDTGATGEDAGEADAKKTPAKKAAGAKKARTDLA